MKKSLFTLLTLMSLSFFATGCGTTQTGATYKAPNGDSTSSAKTGQVYYSEWFEARRGTR